MDSQLCPPSGASLDQARSSSSNNDSNVDNNNNDRPPPYTGSAQQKFDRKYKVRINLVPDAADAADPQDWLCTVELHVHDLEGAMRRGLAWTRDNIIHGKSFYNERLKESSDDRFSVKRTWYMRERPEVPEAQSVWTATVKLWAHEIEQLAQFKPGKLGRGNVSVVTAYNADGDRVFCYDRLRPDKCINCWLEAEEKEDGDGDEEYEDAHGHRHRHDHGGALEWWFWPVGGRGMLPTGVVQRVKGNKAAAAKSVGGSEARDGEKKPVKGDKPARREKEDQEARYKENTRIGEGEGTDKAKLGRSRSASWSLWSCLRSRSRAPTDEEK